MKILPVVISTLFSVVLSACVSAPVPSIGERAQHNLSHHPVDFYTERLATSLFRQLSEQRGVGQAPNIAVSNFLPAGSLTPQMQDEQQLLLTSQLSESMLSHARSLGYAVFEYRLSDTLLLNGQFEQALSRDAAQLSNLGNVDTILTGTYSLTQDALILNARLVYLPTKQVLAAATDYLPVNVFWSTQQVNKRAGYFYRQDRSGEQR
ncbi:FlgO family outer membrane protein [Arsukibacterium sp.]|uniref:FlgO family outer membrane protein n=1 Tax=Arsukibacterium sp. TaxID=1977258 RepID=UPI002FDA5F23